jgi:predicted naringenin-chalcone synthase
MAVYLNHIVTTTPDFRYDQTYIRDFMKHHVAKDRMASLAIHQIYRQSAIDFRYSAIPDFQANQQADASDSTRFELKGGNSEDFIFTDASTGSLSSPTTGQRNQVYEREAKRLFIRAAEQLVSELPQLNKNEISHIITVSCTGFYAPGPDLDVLKGLGLRPDTQRFHIGFMGCYASLTALRLAHSLCKADPQAKVLVVSAELCTLHLKFESDVDSLLSTSVFADGCAAALVTSDPGLSVLGSYEMTRFSSVVTPTGAEDMAWTIGDHGFDMTLSTYIPDIIGTNLGSVLTTLFAEKGATPRTIESIVDEIDLWAVHPGGRAIVDKVANELGLSEVQVEASRDTLKNYGNMSSATILFVLHKMYSQATADPQQVFGMAFGPGLTVESALLTLRRAAG